MTSYTKLLLPLFLGACATAQTTRVVEQALEVEGQHVRLLTDLDEPTAVEMVGVLDLHFQALEQQLSALSGQALPPPSRLELVAFVTPSVLGPKRPSVAVTDELGAIIIASQQRQHLTGTLTHE
ncbi:MAG: hypothetical protein QM765_07900 [Myxococcales bacterium]